MMREAIVAQAKSWLGVRHAPGGRDRSGVSCEGLLIAIAGELGIDWSQHLRFRTPRPGLVASGMAIIGAQPTDDPKPGDFVGIDISSGPPWVHHLGMVTRSGRWAIHVDDRFGVVETPVEPLIFYGFPGAED